MPIRHDSDLRRRLMIEARVREVLQAGPQAHTRVLAPLRPYLYNACEGIDAAVFTGDTLFNDAEREKLKEYIARWQRAIDAHEKDTEGTPQ